MQRVSVMLLIFSAFLAAGGQLLLKLGAGGREQFANFLNGPLFAGLFMYAIGTIIWIYVLSKESLVNVFAFTALTFVLVYLGGVFLLNEKVALSGIIGILLVLSGLYLITSNPS